MASPRIELLTIQKHLFRRNQRLIENSILVKEPEFDRYERMYRRSVARYQRIASQEEMLTAVLAADVIYVGDYHTLNQSQRSFLRILKEVIVRDRRFVVGLELLHTRYQPVLDQFLAGKMSEKVFVRRIRLKEHWVFDLWQNFKPLFDFCRYHHIPMVALDAAATGATVRARDHATAEIIAATLTEKPTRRLFVFIGDLHIAPAHLPREVERSLKVRHFNRRPVILYQNSVSIYWQLAGRALDDRVEVVKVDKRSYCRMHTPPVICQYSYLNWLEHEEGEIDYADAKHSFLELVDHIAGFLRITISKADRESVEVFTAGDLSFLKRLQETKDFSPPEIETIKRQILASESYFIAKARFVYLANLSLNHAAEEAAHFIKHLRSGPEEPRTLVDAFYANIVHEALGFWGSKIVNHKRKCHHEEDFKKLIAYFASSKMPVDRRVEQEAAQLIIEYLHFERVGRPLEHAEIFRSRVDLFVAITHALGYMLGDRLYYGFVDGMVTKREMRLLFDDPWHEEGEPYLIYRGLCAQLQQVKIPKRM